MFDSNNLFSNGQVVTANAMATTELNIAKTSARGVWVEVVVTAASGTSPTLDIALKEKASASVASSDRTVRQFAQMTSTGRQCFLVQTKQPYVNLSYTVGGTSPSFTVTAGIVSGPQRDSAA